jgi:hypothetical protein
VPFDDQVDVIAVHGLNTNLEIRTITYRAQKLVDNMQLHLSIGQLTFPLEEHGGSRGNAGEVYFDVGQKVTAVEVAYGSYINSIVFYTLDGSSRSIGGNGGGQKKTVNFKERVQQMVGYKPMGAWAVGIYGKAKNYIDSIGFYVAYTCRNDTPLITLTSDNASR